MTCWRLNGVQYYIKHYTIKEHFVIIRITLVDLLGRSTSFFWDGCCTSGSDSVCWLLSRLGNRGKFFFAALNVFMI